MLYGLRQTVVPGSYLANVSAFDFLNTAPTTITTTTKKDGTTTTGMVIAVMIPPFRAEESLRVGVTVTVTAVLSTVELRSLTIDPPEKIHL